MAFSIPLKKPWIREIDLVVCNFHRLDSKIILDLLMFSINSNQKLIKAQKQIHKKFKKNCTCYGRRKTITIYGGVRFSTSTFPDIAEKNFIILYRCIRLHPKPLLLGRNGEKHFDFIAEYCLESYRKRGEQWKKDS